MTDAINIIQREHRAIAAVVYCLDRVIKDVRDGRLAPDFDFFRAALDYIQEFPDHFHHPKENDYLFPALAKRSPGSRKVIHDLKEQHADGERRIADLHWKLDAYQKDAEGAFGAFAKALESYIEFQRQHISTEEQKILPAAREHLTPDDWSEINKAFTDNDDPIFGDNPKGAYDRLFSRIVSLAPAPYGLGTPTPGPAGADEPKEPKTRKDFLGLHWV
ncbi:MAG: hemerythrin domain-containing protein [Pseudomonadota bacterium]